MIADNFLLLYGELNEAMLRYFVAEKPCATE